MSDDDEAFVRALVRRVPSLRPALDEHLAYHRELLSHVFFGDVSRWAIKTHRTAPTSEDLVGLLDFLDTARRGGNVSTRELIDASFIENICGEAGLAVQLGPALLDRYKTICGELAG